MNPKYPVYIVSKGRWTTRCTALALDRMAVPYYIVVEPQEYDAYCSVIEPAKVLKLPAGNLGQGSIPARNWIWEDSIERGAVRHWILDDNIHQFSRLNHNFKIPVECGAIFRAAEDFTERYENVALSGFNYREFAPQAAKVPPFYENTRIYSCILIKNDLPYRWRGRYNEDTDLSLRALKDGWCTILFNAFVIRKETTMQMKGGNTDELYQDDGRLRMAKSLWEQHPDVAVVSNKWRRVQHHVDYRPFKANRFKLRRGVTITRGVDEYGMIIVERVPGLVIPEIGIPNWGRSLRYES